MSANLSAAPVHTLLPPNGAQTNPGPLPAAGPSAIPQPSTAPTSSQALTVANNAVSIPTPVAAASALALAPNTTPAQKSWVRDNLLNGANGIGITALILALVFGVGAWVGMNMQYHQGAKGLELSLWTTCADHVDIQNTTLCRSILSKSFDHFQKRSLSITVEETYIARRDDQADDEAEQDSAHTPTRIEDFLMSRSDTERALIVGPESWPRAATRQRRHAPIPELRATLFPLMDVLYLPFRWFFSLVESLLLITVWTIHKLFSWLASVAWFCFQLLLYQMIEGWFESVFHMVDGVIMEAMPDWASGLPMMGLTATVAMSGLKSYWYGISFWHSIKWMFIIRAGMWSFLQAVRGILALRESSRTVLRRS